MSDSTSSRRALLIGYAVVAASVLLVVAGLLVVLVLDDEIGLSNDTSSNAEQTPFVRDGAAAEVAIEGFLYSPADLTISEGATVTWTNSDPTTHDATSRDNDWKTELLADGEASEVTFDEAGTFAYFCSIHPWMEGSITVR